MAQDRESSSLEGDGRQDGRESAPSGALYLLVDLDCSLKMGTCKHCVFEEKGRPERAWDANGDLELDFPRDTVIAALEQLGVVIERQPSYVCP